MPATSKAAAKGVTIKEPFLEIEMGRKSPKKSSVRFDATSAKPPVTAVYILNEGIQALGFPNGVKVYVVPL